MALSVAAVASCWPMPQVNDSNKTTKLRWFAQCCLDPRWDAILAKAVLGQVAAPSQRCQPVGVVARPTGFG